MGQFSEGATICTNDVVGFYLNTSDEEGLISVRRFSDARTETKVTIKTLLTLEKLVLTKNIFKFSEKNK